MADKIIGGILVFVLALFGFLIGILSVELGKGGGPSSVAFAGFIGTALVTASLLWFVGKVLEEPKQGMIAAAVCGLACAITVVVGYQHVRGDIPQMLRLAPGVSAFGLERFDSMDTDGDGLIVESELAVPFAAEAVTHEEHLLHQHMQAKLSEIGHVIDSYVTYMPITHWVGKVPVTTMRPVTHYVYGINRDDLKTYVERVNEKYRNWK